MLMLCVCLSIEGEGNATCLQACPAIYRKHLCALGLIWLTSGNSFYANALNCLFTSKYILRGNWGWIYYSYSRKKTVKACYGPWRHGWCYIAFCIADITAANECAPQQIFRVLLAININEFLLFTICTESSILSHFTDAYKCWFGFQPCLLYIVSVMWLRIYSTWGEYIHLNYFFLVEYFKQIKYICRHGHLTLSDVQGIFLTYELQAIHCMLHRDRQMYSQARKKEKRRHGINESALCFQL